MSIIMKDRSKSGLAVIFISFILLVLINNSLSFMFQLKLNEKKCFYSTIYKEQKLLVEIQTQIIKQMIQINMQVNFHGKSVLNKVLDNLKFSYTVPRVSQNVKDQVENQALQYQTCVDAVSFNKNQTENDFSKNYMISLKLLTDFDHIIQIKKKAIKQQKQTQKNGNNQHTQQSSMLFSKQSLKSIHTMSSKIKSLAEQQIKYHQNNQKVESQINVHLRKIQDQIYSYALFEATLLMAFTFVHITLMSKFLNNQL